MSFSPDGKLIATASQDNSIKLWNTNGELLKTLFGHSNSVWQVNFSSQGDTLVSSSEDRTVIIWDLKRIYELDLLAYGCDWIKDYLHSNVEVKKLVESGEPVLCQSHIHPKK